MASTPDILTTGTRLVYENRWLRLREDAIRRRDGSTSVYTVIEKANFVVIAAIEDGRIHLVEQYRYPVGGRYWELPQGAWEEAPDTDPLALARAELGEETGLEADEWIDAGFLYPAYGFACQGYHVFRAGKLRRGQPRPEPEEQDLVSRDFSIAELEAMIRDSVIKDATTIAALGLLRLKGLF